MSRIPAPHAVRVTATGTANGTAHTPPLVFLHGIGGRASGWAPIQAACAAAGWNSLAWDMPGYGQSPLIEACDFDALADALAALLDAQDLARLARHFVATAAKRHGRAAPKLVTDRVLGHWFSPRRHRQRPSCATIRPSPSRWSEHRRRRLAASGTDRQRPCRT